MEKAQISSKQKTRWYFIFVVGMALILLCLALQKVSWTEMYTTLKQIRGWYILLVFSIYTFSLALRSQRWSILISARKRVDPMKMFWATCVGYLGNTILPARAGELIRSLLLGKESGIDSSFVFATALTERIMDVIALVLISAVVITNVSGELPAWLPVSIQWMAGAGLAAMVIFLLAPRLEPVFHRVISVLPFPNVWKKRLGELSSQFVMGTQSLVHPGRAIGFFLFTAAIWLMDALGSVILAKGLNLSLSLGQALLLLVALGLSSALPSTPGYIGIYQFVAVTVLPSFGLTPSQSLTFILAVQAINITTDIFWGLVGLWRLGVKPSEFFNHGK
jgi:glycosyltransferase 2 family protein